MEDSQIFEGFRSVYAKITIALLKYIFKQGELINSLAILLSPLKNRKFDSRLNSYYETIFVYLYHHLNVNEKVIIKNIEQVSKEGGTIAMTTAERLINRGKKEGKREGIQEGIREGKLETRKALVVNIFKELELPIPKIAKILETDEQFVEDTLKEKGLL